MKIKEKIKALFGLLNKVDVDAKDAADETPLMQAARQNLDAAAELLVKKGADTNTTGFMGDNPLILASKNNNVALVKILISEGVDVNYYNEESIGGPATALMQAAQSNAVDVAELLIDHGADINICHQVNGMTPLMFAVRSHAFEIVKLLIASGTNIEAKTFGLYPSYTALAFCAIDNAKDIAAFLIGKGAKVKPIRAVPRKEIPASMVKWLKARGAL